MKKNKRSGIKVGNLNRTNNKRKNKRKMTEEAGLVKTDKLKLNSQQLLNSLKNNRRDLFHLLFKVNQKVLGDEAKQQMLLMLT